MTVLALALLSYLSVNGRVYANYIIKQVVIEKERKRNNDIELFAT